MSKPSNKEQQEKWKKIYEKVITNEEKKRNLESSLLQFTRTYPFFAAFLQEINIEHTKDVPTAALEYVKKKNEFRVLINANFLDSLSSDSRVALLYHEVLHFTHGHLVRMGLVDFDADKATDEEKKNFQTELKVRNFAADMAINQYIPHIPEGSITHKKFKDDKGRPFPDFATYETYYELLKKHKDNEENKEEFTEGETLDMHLWDQLTEAEKTEMLKKAKEITERTIEKTSREYSSSHSHVQGLLETIESQINKFNYKAILKNAIRNTVSKSEREGTWNRPNRRYGVYAPGTREGKVPFLNIYIDTSGSISHTEINKFLFFIRGLLKVGSSTCNIILWHDKIYHEGKMKKSTTFEDLPYESGGTNFTTCAEHMNKNNPDLAIVLSDCYMSESSTKLKYKNIVWVVSEKGGLEANPHKNVGKSILLSGIV